MNKAGRPSGQYSQAKRETEEAEEYERFMLGEEKNDNDDSLDELELGTDSFDRLEDYDEDDY